MKDSDIEFLLSIVLLIVSVIVFIVLLSKKKSPEKYKRLTYCNPQINPYYDSKPRYDDLNVPDLYRHYRN